eukprot:TRINITY_DN12600_c0_g2_i3.p1 TRINITY_DN12600_c0_g2~~TRINITY_DN12600_c0_g2_i3.p1  ORF type:complete len:787 (-),score=196.47 TRINITY_DN12600_c0_g2_i3:47-2407(-)
MENNPDYEEKFLQPDQKPSGGDYVEMQPDTSYYLDESSIQNRTPSHSLYRHRLNAEEYAKASEFESLDYHVIHNQLYLDDQKRLSDRNRRIDGAQRWVIAFLVGLVTGLVAFLIHLSIEAIQDRKFEAVQHAWSKAGWIVSFFMLFGINVGVILVGTLMIIYFAPAANSSGMPSVKSYLNGTRVPKAFNLKTLFTKIVGCISAVSTTLPVGPEGPMIHIGGMIGGGVSQSRSKTLGCELPFLKKFRNDHDRRDFISSGAACGVAAAFGAPVGGILFAIEEVSSFWSQSLTWRTFFSCIVATFTVNILLSGMDPQSGWGNFDVASLVVFNAGPSSKYRLWELIPFALMGVIGGLTGALFIKINLQVTAFRQKHILPSKLRRIAEVVCIAFFWSFFSILMAKIWACSNVPAHVTDPTSKIEVNEWDCKDGQFNEAASLFFESQGAALRLLFTRGMARSMLTGGSIAMFGLLYFFGAGYIAGSTMAAGLMVPLLIVGASYGRLLGLLMHALFPNSGIDPGAYALIGASSFFGGVTRMTISLSIIMVEITNDLHFLLPIMATVVIAKWVGESFNHPLYDLLIGTQHIPFLESEPAPLMNQMCASDVMSRDPKCFPTVVSVRSVVETLSRTTHNGYPVVAGEGGRRSLKGLILRSQLLVLLEQKVWRGDVNFTFASFQQHMMNQKRGIEDLSFSGEDMKAMIDLTPYWNRSPFSVHQDFSCTFAFRLFRSMGLRHLPVVNDMNEVVGIITRKDLLEPIVEAKHEQYLAMQSMRKPAPSADIGDEPFIKSID